jgi:hypothetical protein
MPPLPVRMNVEMANNFLPRGPHGLGMPPYNLQVRRLDMASLTSQPAGAVMLCVTDVVVGHAGEVATDMLAVSAL